MERGQDTVATALILDNSPYIFLVWENEQAGLLSNYPTYFLGFPSFCWAHPLTNPIPGPFGVPRPHLILSFSEIFPGRLHPFSRHFDFYCACLKVLPPHLVFTGHAFFSP